MQSSPRVLVLLPAYNEQKNIGAVLDKLMEVRRGHGPAFDILVVDDGSNDGTAEEAMSRGINVIKHGRNFGEESSIQSGLAYALRKGYDLVVKIDADGQHEPKHVIRVLRALGEGKADLVIGGRQRDYEEPLLFRCGRAVCRLLIIALTGERIRDATSGFYGFSRDCCKLLNDVYRNTPLLKSDLTNNVERVLVCHRAGLKIKEVPVKMYGREGASKFYSSVNLLKFPLFLIKSVLLAVLWRL